MADAEEADLFGEYKSDEEERQEGPLSSMGTIISSAPSDLKSEKKDKKEKKKDKKDKKEKKKEKKEKKKEDKPSEQGEPEPGADSDPEPAAKRLKKKKNVESFFELEAEDDKGNEDDEEEGLGDEFFDDSGANKPSSAEMQRRTRELDAIQQEMDARPAETSGKRGFDAFLDRMEEKYKEQDEEGEPLADSIETIARQTEKNKMIIPDPKDPKLWMVKLFTNGQERDLCIALLTKFAAWTMTGKPCPVFSCYAADHLKGFLYIEAHREGDVRAFINGIRPFSMWKIILVPTLQMQATFKATLHAELHADVARVGDFIRIKRNTYRGDLGMVEEVRESGYWCKIKPRLDYERGSSKMISTGNKKFTRPPKRFFSMQDAQLGNFVINEERRETPEGFFTFAIIDGEAYRDGYLWKLIRKNNAITRDEVRAQTHEINDFKYNVKALEKAGKETGRESDDEAAEAPELMGPPKWIPQKKKGLEKDTRIPFIPGDVVIVKNGDARNLVAKVNRVLGNGVECQVTPMYEAEGMKDMIFMSSNLRKYFRQGDHVKVIRGETLGNTGFVVKVVEGQEAGGVGPHCIIASDSLNNQEFKCSSANLRLSFEVAAPLESVGEYYVGGIVLVGQRDIGMIVAIEAPTRARVLCAEGAMKDVAFTELEPITHADSKGKGKGSKGLIDAWTEDKKGKRLDIASYVSTPSSVDKGPPVKASVKYVHGNYVFMEAIDGRTGDDRFIVGLGRKVELLYKDDRKLPPRERTKNREQDKLQQQELALKDQKESLSGGTGMRDISELFGGITMASEISWNNQKQDFVRVQEGQGGRAGIPPMAENFKITKGIYKGLRCEFRQKVDAKFARVSLLTKPKIVVVPWENLQKDDQAKFKARRIDDGGNIQEIPVPTTPVAEIEAGTVEPKEKSGSESGAKTGPGSDLDDEPLAIAAAALPAGIEEKDLWDPTYLLQKDEIPNPDYEATPAKRPSDSDADGASQEGSNRSKKQRKSKIPSRTGMPDDSVSESGRSMQSMYRGVNDEDSSIPNTREPWLLEGCAVTFTDDSSKQAQGWIYRVFADTAHLVEKDTRVPETANAMQMENVMPRKGSEIVPVLCSKRGEQGLVFDGPKRTASGKIQGADGGVVYLRLEEDMLNIGLSGDVVEAKKDFVALFSKEWGRKVHAKDTPRPRATPITPSPRSPQSENGTAAALAGRGIKLPSPSSVSMKVKSPSSS